MENILARHAGSKLEDYGYHLRGTYPSDVAFERTDRHSDNRNFLSEYKNYGVQTDERIRSILNELRIRILIGDY